MKMTVLCSGMSAPHAGWVAIDELAYLLRDYFGAELLSSPRTSDHWLRRATNRARTRFEPLQAPGGDVLIVVAHAPDDLAMVSAIPDVRSKYRRLYAFVTDSYFQSGFLPETALFDAITVTAHEDMAYPAGRFGTTVHQLYQGVDAMRWAPRQAHARDIDMIAFGRTPPSYHRCLVDRFHDAGSPYLYLHSPLGHLTGPQVQPERAMLFKLLHRTRISLAFHLMVEPQGDRPRSMMVTSRWLESLLSGCIVAGKRPISRMADDMLNWPGATVELADDPREASDELVALLQQDEHLRAQRRQNIAQTVRQHDWRYRIEAMCQLFDLPVPLALKEDLARLQALAASFE